jgi:hypothetical protein
VFSNSDGQTILKKQQLDEMISGVMVNWLETYYVYDKFGRVKYIISPKGVSALQSGAWTLTSTIRDNYVYEFVYDVRGRLIEKKVPAKGWEYVVYDKFNRPVLSQDALMRLQNKWMFVKYDRYGRTVMQGVYLNTTQTTRATVQTLVDGLYTASNATYPEASWFDSRGSALHGYDNISFPKTNADNSALEVWNVSFYDSYDLDDPDAKTCRARVR